jgi:hypothetical protein
MIRKPGDSECCTPGLSNFKQVVINFLVSKLPVIYQPPPPLLFLALSKNVAKNNTTHDKFAVKAIESTDLPFPSVRRLGLHFIHDLLEVT